MLSRSPARDIFLLPFLPSNMSIFGYFFFKLSATLLEITGFLKKEPAAPYLTRFGNFLFLISPRVGDKLFLFSKYIFTSLYKRFILSFFKSLKQTFVII